MTNPTTIAHSLSEAQRHAPFTIGRALIHLGLACMPRGRARSELYQMMELWGTRARAAILAEQEGGA